MKNYHQNHIFIEGATSYWVKTTMIFVSNKKNVKKLILVKNATLKTEEIFL